MPSFDIVSRLDLQSMDNAINMANRKITQRYDFKGAHILIELNKKEKTLKIEVPDEMKFKAVKEIVLGCVMDQKISTKVIVWGKIEEASHNSLRISSHLSEGIESNLAKDIVKRIKDLGLNVKALIQAEQVRVEGKKIDELQSVIKMLNEADLPIPLQYINMKR